MFPADVLAAAQTVAHAVPLVLVPVWIRNVGALVVAALVARVVPLRQGPRMVTWTTAVVSAAAWIVEGTTGGTWTASAPWWSTVHAVFLAHSLVEAARTRPQVPHSLQSHAWKYQRHLEFAVCVGLIGVHCLHSYATPHAYAFMVRQRGCDAWRTMGPRAWRRVGLALDTGLQWAVLVYWLWTRQWTWTCIVYAGVYLPYRTHRAVRFEHETEDHHPKQS